MTALFFRRAGRPFLSGWLALLSLGAVGCNSGTGDLSGKVSYQGKPLAVGSVLLLGVDAKPRTAWIEADGSYHFTDVPVGEAKLAVYSPDPAKEAELRKKRWKKRVPKDKPAAADLPAIYRTKWFAIPATYSDVDRSGLRVTIQRGPNTFHLDMR